jgi:RNA polymerase sigma factor (sigma-70 family)
MPSPRSQSEPDQTAPTLQELSHRALGGDRLAFDHAVHRLSPGLARFLGKRTNDDAHLTQELCQQAWAEIWTAIAQRRYDPAKAALSTFAYAVAHKVWLRHLRSAGRVVPPEWAALDNADGLVHEVMDQASQIDRVRALLSGKEGNLTDDERWILRSAAAGVSDRELASRLGIAPSSANARKQAALAKLRLHLTSTDSVENGPERQGPSRRQHDVRPTPRKEGEHG